MQKVVIAVVVIVGDNGRNDVNEDGEGGGGVRAGDPRLGQRIWANVGWDGGLRRGEDAEHNKGKIWGGGDWHRHVLSVAILPYRSLTVLVCPEPPSSSRHTGLVKAQRARQPCLVCVKG